MSRQLVRYSSVYSNGTSTAPCCKHHSGSSRHNHSLNARKQVGEIWVSSFYQKLSNQKYPWIFPWGPCFLRRRGIDGSFLVTLLTVIYIKRRYHWKFGFKKSDRWSVLGHSLFFFKAQFVFLMLRKTGTSHGSQSNLALGGITVL